MAMKNIMRAAEKYQRQLVIGFFAIYLLVGAFIFDDYGVSWDEHAQRYYGAVTYEYVFGGNTELLSDRSRYYGPVFMFLLVVIEELFSLESARTVFLMRHAITFLLFYTSVIFFYLLCKNFFRSRKMALLGSLFLILSPRIFADSFFNPKDIPCLSFFIISFYTMTKFIQKKTIGRGLLHACACALLIDVRIVGVFLPFLTVLFFILDGVFVAGEARHYKKRLLSIGVYCVVMLCLVVLFWPTLWRNPPYYFMEAFKSMSQFNKPMPMRYMGGIIEPKDAPWHYVFVWIAVTTPLLYTVSFCIGVFAIAAGFFKNPRAFYAEQKEALMFLAWFVLPVCSVIMFSSALYDGWRQMFFVYPGFLLVGLIGIRSLFYFAGKYFRPPWTRRVSAGLSCAIALNLFFVVSFMVRSHPLQNVYFNSLAGEPREVHHRFEVDYWGLSYREALEYILAHDPNTTIFFSAKNWPGLANSMMLDPQESDRLVYAHYPWLADYFIDIHRDGTPEHSFKKYHTFKVNGITTNIIYDLRNESGDGR